ncbi:hypothetical protein MBLNU230_g0410t1 [Neophaeotheca triangularis]
MAQTHVVSLFLPYTVNFAKQQKPGSRRPSPPARLDSHQHNKSLLDLASKTSQVSLFNGQTPPLTPTAAAEDEFYARFGEQTQRLHFADPGNPRSLVRSDAHVPEWGAQPVYNQPRSKAGPLPSGNILDYAKAHDKLMQDKLEDARKRNKSPPRSQASRTASSERGYEEWTIDNAVQGNGGLVNAMRAADKSEDIDVTWIGTLGCPTDSLAKTTKDDITDKLENEYQALPVYVSDKDLDGHYTHYCKTILWPVFHYQIPDHPKSKAYADHSWGYYRAVNEAFAERVVSTYKRGDIIWVHDYHLLLAPAMIRKQLPEAQIGFFLHTAFPSSEVFRCLATRTELLEGMLGANLVAFQTDEYAQHFLQTCSRILTVEATSEGVQLEDHFVNVISQPIGIDPEGTEEAREQIEVQRAINTLSEQYKDKKVIVAREKLDITRGVRQMLLAYELFLNKYPVWREKVVLILVATSTSESSELLTTVSDINTRINSVHSTLTHQPLTFLKQDLAIPQYLALLSVADVIMISALRDGMNLTAHEYIFCQDGKASEYLDKKHGPLILSEFTGSASVFGEQHLSINPWDYQQQAKAIRKALEMSPEEKLRRWKHLHNVVLTTTGGDWARSLTKALAKVHEEHYLRDSTSIPRLSTTQLTASYKRATKRIFIIDYEGTLAPHRNNSSINLSSLQRVLDTLSDLLADPHNLVYVMSGRTPRELESIFRNVPSLGLIAENGCFVREYGSGGKGEWLTFVDQDAVEIWKNDVRGILKYYQDRMEGSTIEERHCSLIFRYDKATDQEAAQRQAGESANHINDACAKQRIRAVPIHKALLVETVDHSKGSAATHIYEQLRRKNKAKGISNPDFLMVAGDDREDEVIFRWANGLGKDGFIRDVCTVFVGKRNTEAQATLTQGTTGLLSALQKLAKISAEGVPADYFRKRGSVVAGEYRAQDGGAL